MTCPCQSEVEEPGPHIATCPYVDPDYDPDPFGIAELERDKRAAPCHRAPDFEVFVRGVPRPQGSKIRTRYGMRDASDYLKAWRGLMAHDCAERMRGSGRVRGGLEGPLVLGVEFVFARPGKDAKRIAGHFRKCVSVHMTASFARTCQNCHGTYRMLRADAPAYVTTTPDIDKLMRAVQDSLKTAGVYKDDSQVVGYAGFPITCKRYANPGEEPGARIRVWRLP